ncbi:tetratricopeptide repeat protein [Alphaproteobacteria bacterium]|nr:tetratricopeptide repeat protein [Alphaproteobacteria bacterium]
MQNNIQKIFLQAVEDHQNGKSENAKILYREILAYQPYHPDANHNLGVLNIADGNLLLALQLFKKAVGVNPSYEQFWHSYIYTLLKCGQIEDAKKSFIEADKIGIFSKRLSELKKNLISRIQNKNSKINMRPPQNRLDKLLNSLQKKNFIDTEKMAKTIIQEYPNHPYAWKILAAAIEQLDRPEEAILNYQKVVLLTKDDISVYDKLGILLFGQGRPKEALENFKKIISINPDNLAAYNNIGVSFQALGQIDEALKFFKKAIEINPEHIESLNNLGNILKELGRFQESYHYFQKAIDLKPDYADAYNNLGRALMLNFDFQKAFELMEWRLRREEKNFIPLNTSKPRWDGLTKHRVFVWREQGIGDWIMFSSMIPELHASVEKVIVECDPRVIPLFQRSFSEEIQFITDRTEISEDDYDSHLPIGSLPFHFRKELDDFKKSSQGWLQADIERFQCIKEKISQNKSKKIVGISWNTKSSLTQAFQRNIKLEDLLLPLKDLDFIFVNLQYGDVSEEINNLKVNHGIDVLEIPDLDIFNDIDGLSAIIAACDSVISIDNLNPHLAGALNIRTQLLITNAADDRWGHKTSKSYWYDSITIHRQAEPRNWDDPLLKASNDLYILINK